MMHKGCLGNGCFICERLTDPRYRKVAVSLGIKPFKRKTLPLAVKCKQECNGKRKMLKTEYKTMEMREYETRFSNTLIQSNPGSMYGTGKGDGIIYVGGGKYWPGIVAGIRLLRTELKCTLPVEVWYRGDCEEVNPADVYAFPNVTFHDVDELGRQNGDNRVPTGKVASGGWEAKLYAIYHTSLDRVLFLDADAYCVNNPVPLFQLLDNYSFRILA
jgi:hypothetical protein